jgi:N-acetylglucosamine-6-sulfatase
MDASSSTAKVFFGRTRWPTANRLGQIRYARGVRRWRRGSAVIALMVLAGGAMHASPAPAASTPPNIVLILTDDQRVGTLWAMPKVRHLLGDHGITFKNAFVSNPICCPSRASILTGLYSHTTRVYHNATALPFGGWKAFDPTSTVATWLDAAGYRTALLGKYLNGYTGTSIPPGWDRWFVTYRDSAYYDYTASDNGVLRQFGSKPSDYGTTVLAERAVSFIESTDPTTPLFLHLSPHAPHAPSIPAPGDGTAFGDLGKFRPPNYNEEHVGDKPKHIRELPLMDKEVRKKVDKSRLLQYRSLLAVDRAVADVVAALEATGRLSNTLIVFTSDNGMAWGEHRWHRKVVPYEESIRVPMVIRFDPALGAARADSNLVLNIDLAPTFAEVAGLPSPIAEGRSLVPLFASPDVAWRSAFLIEHKRAAKHEPPTYCGIRTERYVFVEYSTHEKELYDLAVDPYQLLNRAKKPSYQALRNTLRSRLKELCTPRPPGFSFG